MSKLDKLIAELCPDGVEYKKIKDICTISRGIVISKDNIRNNAGEYPVYSSQTENNGELGKISTFAYDGKYLTWTTDGANAGTVFYRTGKFNVTNVCGLLKIVKPEYSVKYVYHILKVEAPKYVRRGMGNPKLMSNVMGDIKIPLPPLPIQEEIVRILDNFTELTAELTAELTDRKKQYEYYRDSLLTFDDDVEWKTLGDIGKFTYGYAAKAQNSGSARFVRITDINTSGKIIPTNAMFVDISKENERYILKKNDLLMARTGATFGKTMIFEEDYPAIYAGFLIKLNFPKKFIYPKYYWHFSQSELFWYQANKLVSGGGQPQFNANALKMVKIPIPYPNDANKSLTEQQRIVDILDRFDTLVNDITQGLPAEIELRKKQYEYYRDKLLTFKKLQMNTDERK